MTAQALNMLTVDEVAGELGVSKTKVEGWVRRKEIASFLKDRVRRILREDLVRFVMLHMIHPKRAEWLTAEIETKFRRELQEMIEGIVRSQLTAEMQRRGELQAA